MPSIRTSLLREVSPDRRRMLPLGTPSSLARNSMRALLAAPSTGGAVRAILRAPLCAPATLLADDLGATYTLIVTPEGVGSIPYSPGSAMDYRLLFFLA